MSWLEVVADVFRGATLGPNERLVRQETAGVNEVFILLCLMEAASVRNPATFCLLGTLLDRRVGIGRPPLEDLRCC